MSDLHIDSKRHNEALRKRHMQMAVDDKAPIVIFGDLFDAKESKFDPRKTGSKKEEINDPAGAYINNLISYAANGLEPYANNIALIGLGNHETALRRKLDVDIMPFLARELHSRGCNPPIVAGYGGWIILRYRYGKTMRGAVKIYFHHGAGGGGPVTRGAIKAHRRATFVEGADYVLSGHIHNPDYNHYRSVGVSDRGRVFHRDTHHLVLPSYQRSDQYSPQGWEVEKEFPPTPTGCVRLDITFGEPGKGPAVKAGKKRIAHKCNFRFMYG
jgi:UDP-2,3-diacylglucosamine pyrophosphatase LpxH